MKGRFKGRGSALLTIPRSSAKTHYPRSCSDFKIFLTLLTGFDPILRQIPLLDRSIRIIRN